LSFGAQVIFDSKSSTPTAIPVYARRKRTKKWSSNLQNKMHKRHYKLVFLGLNTEFLPCSKLSVLQKFVTLCKKKLNQFSTRLKHVYANYQTL
jgi:hypothetical protein